MAKRRKHRNASRGSVNNIILRTLANGDKYGYEIIKEVEEYSDGKIKLKQPSLYSSLTRFEDKGLVTSYWGDSDIGGRRHYYHLTENGYTYYRIHVLKESTDNNSDEDDEILDEEIDDVVDEIIPPAEEPVETKMDIHEIDSDTIPSIVNFDDKDDIENILPDDAYHTPTPLEILSEENINTPPLSKKDTIIAAIKANNRRHINSPFKRLHYIKPKKKKIIILDKDGIYKLRDENYVPTKEVNNKPHFIDNVGRRTKDMSFGYADYTENHNTEQNIESQPVNMEMTEEERKRRNEIFLAKFNELSKAKMKYTVQQETNDQADDNIENDIDYKSKLDLLMDDSESESISNTIDENENNLFNYDDQSDYDDQFVDFDDTDENLDNEQSISNIEEEPEDSYNKEISQYSSNTIKINKYENAPKAVLLDKSYILINKLKFIFGFVLLFVLLLETTISVLLFKSNDLIGSSEKTFIIIVYIAEVLLSLIFILPYILNPHEHKFNNYKTKYACLFGFLTFLICLILIYCINALAGFELDNFKYFAVKLILPAILSTNFILCPLIYGIFTKLKIFYD